MRSILSYKDRGQFGDAKYRGNFSGRMIEDLNRIYKFDEISDYMCGSNTTGDFCKYKGIKSNTYDLNIGYDLMTEEIKEINKNIIWHPPYWDIIKYSGNMYGKGQAPLKNDLSNMKDYNDFIRAINYCLAKQYSSLKVGGRMFILMADVKKNHKLYSMLLDMQKLGTIEQIVIKEQLNCMSDNKSYANENFIRIAHEYLLILRKDNPYLYNMKIVKNLEIDIRDSLKITWKDLVAAVLQKTGKSKLENIYKEIDGHKKCMSNCNWREKVRQTLQIYNIFESNERGIWGLVSSENHSYKMAV